MFRHDWQVPLAPASGVVPNEVLPPRAVLRVRKLSRELEDISAIELCEALNSRSGSRSGSRSRSSSTSASGSHSSPCGLHVVGSPISVRMEHLGKGEGKVSVPKA